MLRKPAHIYCIFLLMYRIAYIYKMDFRITHIHFCIWGQGPIPWIHYWHKNRVQTGLCSMFQYLKHVSLAHHQRSPQCSFPCILPFPTGPCHLTSQGANPLPGIHLFRWWTSASLVLILQHISYWQLLKVTTWKTVRIFAESLGGDIISSCTYASSCRVESTCVPWNAQSSLTANAKRAREQD